jgi:RimJ/RimL family protein N-acetyltransferase
MNYYKALTINEISSRKLKIVPIRFEDRFLIMKWRNEQIYHLRQNTHLSENDQNNYFENIIGKLFKDLRPSQILFSFLENEKCIGYGGLVHINWNDKNAELSFIMDTSLEKENFFKYWTEFISLIEKVIFDDLNFKKTFVYAFDLRPQLYEVLKSSGFVQEARLKKHCLHLENFIDVLIYSKFINE